MTSRHPTCWRLIRGAADGDLDARHAFAASYLPVVRAYLVTRWSQGPLRDQIDPKLRRNL